MYTVKTHELKKAVTFANACATREKMLPLTSMVGIEFNKEQMKLVTTDTANTVIATVSLSNTALTDKGMDIVVSIDTFANLVFRTTSETMVFKEEGGNLHVTGNGTYRIPIVMDGEGPVQMPVPEYADGDMAINTVNLVAVKSVLQSNSASIARNFNVRYLTSFYLGDVAITTDDSTACLNEVQIFDTPVLLSEHALKLLAMFEDTSIPYNTTPKGLFCFHGQQDDVTLFISPEDDIDQYPVNELSAYLSYQFPYACKVSKTAMTNVLKRLSLFVEPYDKNSATMTFTDKTLGISSLQMSGVEYINYKEGEKTGAFSCTIDIQTLADQVAATPSDLIEIHYGDEYAVKLVSNQVNLIISLMTEED